MCILIIPGGPTVFSRYCSPQPPASTLRHMTIQQPIPILTVNLLPWRAQQCQRQQQFFLFLLTTTILACLTILWSFHHYLKKQHEELQKQMQQLNTEYLQLADLQKQQTLKKENQQLINFLSLLTKITPNQIYLTQIEKNQQKIVVHGITSFIPQLTHFTKQLQIQNFNQPSQPEIKRLEQTRNETQKYTFSFKTILKIADTDAAP